MPTKGSDNTSPAHIGEVSNRLQIPVPDVDTLIAYLCGPLDCLGLLPPRFRVRNTQPLQSDRLKVSKHIPALQKALLDHVLPTWSTVLAEHNATPLLDQYFCPDNFQFASPAAGDIVLLAYSTILSQALTDYGTYILARLSKEYPIDRIYAAIFSHASGILSYKRASTWEDYVRNVAAVPAKVANKLAGARPIPPLLEHGAYFNHLCQRSEVLMYSLVSKLPEDFISPMSYLLTKLVNLGVFPSSPPVPRSQPSFFQVTLSTIRARLGRGDSQGYSDIWFAIINGLSSSIVLQSILVSLFASLTVVHSDPTLQRAHIKREACLIHGLLGEVQPEREELWESVQAITLGRDWDELYSRVFICWIAGSYGVDMNIGSLGAFLETVLDMWSSQDHIKHSLLSRHHYVTSLFLVTISYLPKSSEAIQSLALSPEFITGIGRYISHLDPSIRRCGMLTAEVIAHLSGKKLDFRDWDGNDAGKPWARELRKLILARDIDVVLEELAEVDNDGVHDVEEIISSAVRESGKRAQVVVPNPDSYDSDDSMTGYESPASSRSSSPTPSELAEIERDPTIHVGVKKLPRPVYLAQLGDLIRGSGGVKTNDNHEADRIEMALNCAEELIRRKKGYGTELEENAVNITYGLLGLQDNYDLDGFEDKRQASLTALVACCPQKAAPALIEEFFKNQYSTNQRYVVLNALALGARDLASLAVPLPTQQISFPSKVLPPALHNKYLASNPANQIPQIVDSLSQQATDRGKGASLEKIPELVRERRLRIQRPPKVEELKIVKDLPQHKGNTFTQIAAEYFIAPLINRFWLFLRDENTREERTIHRAGRERYHGAGTGLILNPVVLSHFLKTIAILVHASHLAPEWMSIIAPDALEMAVTLGTRPVSNMASNTDDTTNTPGNSSEETLLKEASVLTSALELALIVLDGCLELDGGRILGLEHTALTLGTAEWASAVFSGLEKGLKAEGGGGVHEVKLRRAAAGVIIKVEELRSRWGRSMLDTR